MIPAVLVASGYGHERVKRRVHALAAAQQQKLLFVTTFRVRIQGTLVVQAIALPFHRDR